MTVLDQQNLAPFVPRLTAELGFESGSTWTSVEGSMLSADISGFTALSERLASKGKAGAEEITSLINSCFTALIEAAYDYGGEIIKFGGDALLVLFRGDAHERRCANAALEMQIRLHAAPAAKRANLTMTVGASHGPFDVFLVGSGYRDLLIIGDAASQVIHLEGEAAKGETLVSPYIASLLPDEIKGREHAGGIAISGPAIDPASGTSERSYRSPDLTAFIPTQVINQLEAFAELEGEHRIVSVGFVMVTGVADCIEGVGPDGTAEALGNLVDDVISATMPYGVTALHTDIAGDGFKFVLCAGAPVSSGDTSDALLQAALDIAAIDTPFVIRQGAQTGRVFAGFLGSAYRRTYTLMGDPVNTAARMLGKAGDRDVVAVATMIEDTRTVFVTEELEPFLVKGKTEPIVAHKVHAVTDDVHRGGDGSPMFGREDDLRTLLDAIAADSAMVEITGEAGTGKSRLVEAALADVEDHAVFRGACTPYGVTSAYSVMRPLLRGGFGIDLSADAAEAGELLEKVVEAGAPHLAGMLPLLALPFGASVASTPEADAVDPEFRRARMHDALVALIDAALAGSALLVIEDLHWVDDASGELINHLVRAAADRPWAGMLTRRPEGPWVMSDAGSTTTMRLGPLDDDAVRQMAIATGTRALSDPELELIVARSNGNPLFAVELIRAVCDGGADELPDSVEKVISTRIDDLQPDVRRLVRVAAVFGTTFDPADLEVVLAEQTRGIDDEELADIFEPRGTTEWGFRQALYRDVAYEGLPFRQRKQLHRAIGEGLEARATDLDAMATTLSVHFFEARATEKTWKYSVLAGDAAADVGANAEAAAAYHRAVTTAPRRIEASERARIEERLGDVSWGVGQLDVASTAYQRARRWPGLPAQELRLRRKIGMIRENEGRQSVALRWYSRALAMVADISGDPAVATERAQLLLATAGVRHRQGDNESCAALAQEAERFAEEADDIATRALAHDRQLLASAFLGRPDDGGHGPAALELYAQVGNAAGEARVFNNMGIAAYFAGDWSQAADLYASAVERSRAAGDVVLAGIGAMNQAEILADQGHPRRAAEILDDVIRNWTSIGYGPGVAAALSFRGIALARASEFDAAREDLDDSFQRSTAIGAASLIVGARLRRAELELLQGHVEAAIDELAALDSMPEAAQSDVRRRASLLGAIAKGDDGLAELAEIAAAGSDYDQACAIEMLARRTGHTDPDAAAVAEGLGIIAFADYPTALVS